MYAEFVSDPKVQLLAFEDQRHFVALLCLKCCGTLDSEAPNETYRDRMIAKALGLSLEAAIEARRRLVEVGIVADDWQPVRWSDRQFESDLSTERVRKHRKRFGNVTETPQIRTEQIQNRPEEGAGAPSRATRLPDDFALTPERRAVAEAERLPADRTFAEFCDYWRAASGQKARKCDWEATWRNWCRRQVDFRPARQQPGSKPVADPWPDLHHRKAKSGYREPREGESPQAYGTLLTRHEDDIRRGRTNGGPVRFAPEVRQ
jgi:hypothetical protein